MPIDTANPSAEIEGELSPEVAQRPVVLATGRVNLETARNFLRGLVARLSEDDLVVLEAGEDEPRRWTVTVKALLGGDLDAILRDLPVDTRLFVGNRSGGRAFALATFDTVEPATFVLDLGDRRVSVAVLEEPVEDDPIENAWISVPGFGGVEIVSEGECIDLGDELERVYANAFADEVEGGVVEDGDPPSGGIVEGDWSEETAARTVTLAVNQTAKAKYKWRNITSTLDELAEMMLTHPEDASKDGMSILQGELVGEERLKKAVRACDVAALDLDTGENEEEIKNRVRRLGKCAFLHSTHSHLRTRNDVARQHVLKFANGREIDDELLAEYLREEKGVRPEIAESVRIVDPTAHTADGVRIIFDHAPWPKFRLFLPLRGKFVLAERNEDADLNKATQEWKGKLHGLARMLGVCMDESCTDPCRLFYTPRHKPGAPFVSWAYRTDELLDLDEVPTVDPRRPDDAWSRFGEASAGREHKVKISEANRWLFGWAKRYGRKFEIDGWLQQYLPDYMIGDRPSGPGVTTKCPNHELNGRHSTEQEGGTFAAPPDPAEERSFVWHCTHDHCRDHDKLSFLDLILREGLVEKRDLFDPAYLLLEQGEDDPPEWDPRGAVEIAKAAVERLKNREAAYAETVAAIAGIWADLDPMQQGELVSALSGAAKVTKTKVRKHIEAQVDRRSIDPATLAAAEQNLAELFRLAFDGDEYAVLWNEGHVGVMRLGSQGERSMMPDIATKHDFATLYENKNIPQIDDKGGVTFMPAAKAWFGWSERPTYKGGLCFEPDASKVAPGQYNLWQGFARRARKGGRWDLLEAHVRENLCGGDDYYYAWVMTWSAHLVQFPGQKPGTALVFRGKKGTGKSFFGMALGELVRPYFMVLSTTQDIVGQFNSHLAGRLLVLGDEGVWGGAKRDEGALKNLVTSETIAIERKHFSKVSMSNFTRFVFASNEGWVIPSDFDHERRFLVLDVLPDRQNDYEYFGRIDRQLRDGGYEAMMADLLEWKPLDGDWDILKVAPQTSATDEQKERGAGLAEKFLIDLVERGEFETGFADGGRIVELNVDEPNIVAFQTLLGAFRAFVQNASGRDKQTTSANPRDLRKPLATVLLAEHEGDNRPLSPLSNEILGHWPVPGKEDNKVRCVSFPPLREIVETHRAERRFGFFNAAWIDE